MMLAIYASTAASIRSLAAYKASIHAIAEWEGVPVATVQARRRASMAAAHLHNRALYLAVTVFQVPARAVARAAGVNERQVRLALARIEEEREQGAVDRMLDEIELRIMP